MLVTILWNGCVRYVGGDVKVQYKLQALVYDILPWRKVPESDARSVGTVYYSLGTGTSLRHLWGTHNIVSSYNHAVMLLKV